MKLKNLAIITLAIILMYNFSFSQEDVLRPRGKKIIGNDEIVRAKHRIKPFILGLEAGANLNFYSQDLIWKPTANFTSDFPTIYDTYKSGFGVSPHFALYGELPINDKWSINARINWDNRSFGGNGTGYSHNLTNAQRVDMTLDWSVNTNWFGIAVGGKYNIDDKLFLNLSLLYDIILDNGEIKLTPTANDVALKNVNFYPYFNLASNTGTSSELISDLERVDSRTAIEFGVGYKMPISKSIYLVPQARFQFYLTPMLKDVDVIFSDLNSGNELFRVSHKSRFSNTMQLALGLWFEL